jgi:folate-binding protein YgfZ
MVSKHMTRVDTINNNKMDYKKTVSSYVIKDHVTDILRLQGRDTLDFLQRMSTNDIINLEPNQNAITVLTNEKGRIVDLVYVCVLENEIYLLTSHDNGHKVKEWLERFVITEDVVIENVGDLYACLLFIGHDALKGKQCLLKFRNPMWSINAYVTIIPFSYSLPINDSSDIISENSFDTLRIEQGIPLYGRELSDQINPLEAGLEKYVSFTKGCYIGQEIIARLDTYKKIQKKMSGIILDAKEPINELGKLYYQDEQVGWTTSHAWSYTLNKQIALGYVKTYLSASSLDFISNDSLVRTTAQLSLLPFSPKSF